MQLQRTQLLLVFALLGLGRRAALGQSSEPRLFIDDNGDICSDTVEVVQKLEYDEQVHCKVVKKEPGAKVRMREICDDFRPEQQLQESPRKFQSRPRCKTESRRQCKTVFEPQASLVKVRICPGDTNDDPERQKRLQARPNAGFLRTMASLAAFTLKRTPYEAVDAVTGGSQAKKGSKFRADTECVGGKRRVCEVKHETVCNTEHIKAETVEDHPVCRVEMVDNCDKSRDKFGACERVPAMRCRIEQRVVVQSKPETKCERVPQSLCHEEECRGEAAAGPLAKADDPLCYFRDQVVNEIVPKEKCEFVPQQVCEGDDIAPRRLPNSLSRRVKRQTFGARLNVANRPEPTRESLLSRASAPTTSSSGRQNRRRRLRVIKRRKPVARKIEPPTTPRPTEAISDDVEFRPPPAIKFINSVSSDVIDEPEPSTTPPPQRATEAEQRGRFATLSRTAGSFPSFTTRTPPSVRPRPAPVIANRGQSTTTTTAAATPTTTAAPVFSSAEPAVVRTSELVKIQQELKQQQLQQQRLHQQRQQQLMDFHELKLKATPNQENQTPPPLVPSTTTATTTSANPTTPNLPKSRPTSLQELLRQRQQSLGRPGIRSRLPTPTTATTTTTAVPPTATTADVQFEEVKLEPTRPSFPQRSSSHLKPVPAVSSRPDSRRPEVFESQAPPRRLPEDTPRTRFSESTTLQPLSEFTKRIQEIRLQHRPLQGQQPQLDQGRSQAFSTPSPDLRPVPAIRQPQSTRTASFLEQSERRPATFDSDLRSRRPEVVPQTEEIELRPVPAVVQRRVPVAPPSLPAVTQPRPTAPPRLPPTQRQPTPRQEPKSLVSHEEVMRMQALQQQRLDFQQSPIFKKKMKQFQQATSVPSSFGSFQDNKDRQQTPSVNRFANFQDKQQGSSGDRFTNFPGRQQTADDDDRFNSLVDSKVSTENRFSSFQGRGRQSDRSRLQAGSADRFENLQDKNRPQPSDRFVSVKSRQQQQSSGERLDFDKSRQQQPSDNRFNTFQDKSRLQPPVSQKPLTPFQQHQELGLVQDVPRVVETGAGPRSRPAAAAAVAVNEVDPAFGPAVVHAESGCRIVPSQECEKVQGRARPVLKNMVRRVCRTPRGESDLALVRKLLKSRQPILPVQG